jgi:DNA gyrase subunit A
MEETRTDQGGPINPAAQHINIEDEMKSSYLDYAMSVIIGRALPDVRDGLKPVHRRILYAMYREGLLSSKKHSKCAGVVGEVLKKFHPHGDAAVYDTLVRMAQPWNMRYTLIDGQGNFGSVDGDPAAAYRYTECRLTKIAEEALADIDEETVDFTPNFDGQTEEPVVLPSKFPNLLVNGSSGIAVGMATNIPPHNMREVIDGACTLIDNPEVDIDELMKIIPGPDFPTAGYICGREGIASAYRTGRGLIKMRARASIEESKKGDKRAIIVTEIPYQVNKAKLIERIADLVKDKKIEGISDIRDESDREGMRIAIDLKRDAVPEVVLNQLFKHTPMQESFGVIMLAIVGGQPKVLNLKEMLEHFVAHRREVVTRRCRFRLRKAEEQAHILEGLKIAIDNIDEVISIIRGSPSTEVARQRLMERFELSHIQAQAILEMRLQKLTGLEREKIVMELSELYKEIERLTSLLGEERLLMALVAEELREVQKKFGDERRTEIVADAAEIDVEDLIVDEDMVVTVSHAGYIKRNALSLYRRQRRGGKGRTGMATKEEDFVEDLFIASTHSYILIFTDRGRIYWLKVHEVPEAGPAAKGKAIVNLIQFQEGEKMAAIVPVREFEENKYVFMCTRKGTVKKTSLTDFSHPRAGGIAAINIDDDDTLLTARVTNGSQEIVLATSDGMAVRFKETDVRPMGRYAAGVRGALLEKGDRIIGMEVCDPGSAILSVSENGYGKRTQLEEYRLIRRGGKGVITIKTNDRNGKVISILLVTDLHDIMLITDGGTLIRCGAEDIRLAGRNTMGVRLIALREGEKVVSAAKLAEKDEENGNGESPPPADEPAGDQS